MKYAFLIVTIIILLIKPSVSLRDEKVVPPKQIPASSSPNGTLDTSSGTNKKGQNRLLKTVYASETYDTTSDNIESLICQIFGDDCQTAIKIAKCESGLRPNAIGDSSLAYSLNGIEYGKSYGIFQIRHLPGRPDPNFLLNPIENIKYAHGMYQNQGWNPWTCSYKLALNK